MQIIPVINCPDLACARERAKIASGFSRWVHVDVCDGQFAPVHSWNSPEELSLLLGEFPGLSAEVHLMIEEPERCLSEWFEAGASRAVVHWETLGDHAIISKFPGHIIALSTKIETPIEDMLPYLVSDSWVHLLAVAPGPAGQRFDPSITGKIAVLRERYPELVIEVDGGITPETIRFLNGAANIAVSATYIFKNPDPAAAFRELQTA
jgi:ribulose-phosphate 3-epimerase